MDFELDYAEEELVVPAAAPVHDVLSEALGDDDGAGDIGASTTEAAGAEADAGGADEPQQAVVAEVDDAAGQHVSPSPQPAPGGGDSGGAERGSGVRQSPPPPSRQQPQRPALRQPPSRVPPSRPRNRGAASGLPYVGRVYDQVFDVAATASLAARDSVEAEALAMLRDYPVFLPEHLMARAGRAVHAAIARLRRNHSVADPHEVLPDGSTDRWRPRGVVREDSGAAAGAKRGRDDAAGGEPVPQAAAASAPTAGGGAGERQAKVARREYSGDERAAAPAAAAPQPPPLPLVSSTPTATLRVSNLARPWREGALQEELAKHGKLAVAAATVAPAAAPAAAPEAEPAAAAAATGTEGGDGAPVPTTAPAASHAPAAPGGWWVDRMRTAMYVDFATVDDAAAARTAVDGAVWPPVHGKPLKVEFSNYPAARAAEGEAAAAAAARAAAVPRPAADAKLPAAAAAAATAPAAPVVAAGGISIVKRGGEAKVIVPAAATVVTATAASTSAADVSGAGSAPAAAAATGDAADGSGDAQVPPFDVEVVPPGTQLRAAPTVHERLARGEISECVPDSAREEAAMAVAAAAGYG